MKVSIRWNALGVLLIAVGLVALVLIMVDRPSTELILALVAPVVGGAIVVVDKLCSPEPREQPEDPLVSLMRDCLAKLPNAPIPDTSEAARLADRSRHPPPHTG